MPNCNDGATKAYWVKQGWAKQPHAPEALYDLRFDPNEGNNLAGDSSHQPVLEDMRRRLDSWMHSTNDPLLFGPVKAPSGATINDPDELSPNDPGAVVP